MSKKFSKAYTAYPFFRSLISCLVLALPLLSCSGGGDSQVQNNAANEPKYISASWVLIGTDSVGNNQAIARVATSYVSSSGEAICPNITIDGLTSQMTMRVVAGLMPLRSTDYQPSVPANFPV